MELNLLNLSLDLPDMSGVIRKSLESELELYSSIIWVYMNQEKICIFLLCQSGKEGPGVLCLVFAED